MPSSVYPQSLTRQPHGACGFAIARRRLRCFDFLKEVSLTLQRGPEGPFQFYICLILTITRVRLNSGLVIKKFNN